MSYAVDGQSTIKEPKTINAKENITSKVISLADSIKSALASKPAVVFAVAA